MLTDLTYTPDPEAEAAILPCLPDHLRAQALRLLAELSEHARSIEKPAQGSRVSLNRSRKHIRVPKSKERVELAARCV